MRSALFLTAVLLQLFCSLCFAESIESELLAKAKNSNDVSLLFNIGGLYAVKHGDYQNALWILEKAKRLAPEHCRVRESLAMVLDTLDRIEERDTELAGLRNISESCPKERQFIIRFKDVLGETNVWALEYFDPTTAWQNPPHGRRWPRAREIFYEFVVGRKTLVTYGSKPHITEVARKAGEDLSPDNKIYILESYEGNSHFTLETSPKKLGFDEFLKEAKKRMSAP